MPLLLVTQFTTRRLSAYTLIRLAITKVQILERMEPSCVLYDSRNHGVLVLNVSNINCFMLSVAVSKVVRCSKYFSHLELGHVEGT